MILELFHLIQAIFFQVQECSGHSFQEKIEKWLIKQYPENNRQISLIIKQIQSFLNGNGKKAKLYLLNYFSGNKYDNHIKEKAVEEVNKKLDDKNINIEQIEQDDYEAMVSDLSKDIREDYAKKTSQGLLALIGLDMLLG